MKSPADLIAEYPDASDVEIADLHNGQAPTPKESGPATYVTYLSIGDDVGRFGPDAMNMAGRLRAGLAEWIAGPDLSQIDPALPCPGALQTLDDRLAGSPGVDVSSLTAPGMLALFVAGVAPVGLSPLLTQATADAMATIGWDVPPTINAADVTTERARLALTNAKDAAMVVIEQRTAADRTAVNAATSAEQLAPWLGDA